MIAADPLDFYAASGPMTDLAGLDRLLIDVPNDPVGIAQVVQGVVVHPFLAHLYGIEAPPLGGDDVQIRGADSMVRRIATIDPRPLVEPRPPAARFFGNCRHFSTLTVALLRRAGVPSRARCGFGGYFEPGRWVDHWIVEHWNGERWVSLDPQIDEIQRDAMGVADPTDLAPGLFLPAGEAWRRCRNGLDDPEHFGILDMWGLWFIRGNVGRDIAALNKVEMLPWDDWGELATDRPPSEGDDYVDQVAALTTSDDIAAIRDRYEHDPGLRVPSRVVAAFTAAGPMEVDVVELSRAAQRSDQPAG